MPEEVIQPDFPNSLREFLRKPRTLTALSRKLKMPSMVCRDRMLVLMDHGLVKRIPARDFRAAAKYQLSIKGETIVS
jgi:hypothetical protein